MADTVKQPAKQQTIVEHYYVVRLSGNGSFVPHSMTEDKEAAHRVAATVKDGYVLTLSREG